MASIPGYNISIDELSIGFAHYLKIEHCHESNQELTDNIKNTDDTLWSIVSRVDILEATCIDRPPDKVLSRSDVSSVIRAKLAVQTSKCYSAIWKWVPASYYDLTLEERAKLLCAPDKMQLCKALLFKNRSVESSNFDRNNAQFYLVVVQYAAEINTKKLELEVRTLLPLEDRLEPSKYSFRLASEEDNDRLTGYAHNSVTPFGMAAHNQVPIIVASTIVSDLKFMFMGGGHVDLKLGCAVNEFCSVTNAFILDISDSR